MKTLLHKTGLPHNPKIWVISDGRGISGNLNGCLSVADELGGVTEVIDITAIQEAGGAKQYLQKAIGLSHGINHECPDFIVTFFINTLPVAAEMKALMWNKSPHPVFLIQINAPSRDFGRFDLIVQPAHEGRPLGDNVLEIVGAPHRVTEMALKEGYGKWRDQLTHYDGKTKIAVILGGNTPASKVYSGGGEFPVELATALGRQVNALAERDGACLLVTNSPRTPPGVWKAFMGEIAVDGYFHDVHMDTQNLEKGNPYLGMLEAADRIIVTADSVSMLCEASSTGKPLYVAAADASHLRPDHKSFVQTFVELGYAELLTDNLIAWESRPRPKPLNTAADIANRAKQLYSEMVRDRGRGIII